MARILVAEDNDQLRQLLATLLADVGHEVVVARDGAEALVAAENARFDLLITDYVMPIVDGAELAMALQDHPTTIPPPVIVYSAYPPEGKLLPLVESSKVHYVSKGQRVDALLERVEDLLAAS